MVRGYICANVFKMRSHTDSGEPLFVASGNWLSGLYRDCYCSAGRPEPALSSLGCSHGHFSLNGES